MITTICMILLVLALGAVVLYTDAKGKQSNFFDIESTNCMRGIWCIIILLVHIPLQYQNPIQDILGSFAYIGVTFFFMTSGYGLTLSVLKDPEQIKKSFWRRRLLKLLIPMLFVNILRTLVNIIAYREFTPLDLISVTGFVRQLLFLYFVFWIIFRFAPKRVGIKAKCNILCGIVAVISVLVYFWGNNPLFGWPIEALGFLYGILLANYKDRLLSFAHSKWFAKSATACVLSLLLGVTYLMFKDVVFIPLIAMFPNMNSGIFINVSIIITVIISLLINKLSKIVLALRKRRTV